MFRKYLVGIALFCLLPTTILGQEKPWTTVVQMASSPIRDQGKSASCWAYACSSFLASEQIRIKGTYTPLSEVFFVKNIYYKKARTYVLRKGKFPFEGGGMIQDVLKDLHENGAIPLSNYRGRPTTHINNDHRQLHDSLRKHLDDFIRHPEKFPKGWSPEFDAILSKHMGKIPQQFKFKNATYSPFSFGKELGIDPMAYVTCSSWLSHPFYEYFVLEAPYNFSHTKAYNLPIDELIDRLDKGLQSGYTALLECDATNPYFLYREGAGIAVVPTKKIATEEVLKTSIVEQEISQQRRQLSYEKLETSQDHIMHIVGIVKDAKGKKLYTAQNSWGPNRGLGGYMYLSEAYIRLHLISLSFHKEVFDL